jgi:hypothetical protein
MVEFGFTQVGDLLGNLHYPMVAGFAKGGDKDIMFRWLITAKSLFHACCAEEPPFHEEFQKLFGITQLFEKG